MSYRLILKASAEKELADLPKPIARRVVRRIESLGEEPRPAGVTKLAGVESTYRIRVGDYRVVYVILDEEQTVHVTAIAHRRDVYRGL